MILPIEGDEKSGWKPGKPSVFLSTPAVEAEPMFAPDGRWIAYQSNESGRTEVFVRPFPGPGGKWQISTGGGMDATWSQTRRELLYRNPVDQRIMAASYSVDGASFKADKPHLWSQQTIFATGQKSELQSPSGWRTAGRRCSCRSDRTKIRPAQLHLQLLRRTPPDRAAFKELNTVLL
jgi:Tol biopolymer transport system component